MSSVWGIISWFPDEIVKSCQLMNYVKILEEQVFSGQIFCASTGNRDMMPETRGTKGTSIRVFTVMVRSTVPSIIIRTPRENSSHFVLGNLED